MIHWSQKSEKILYQKSARMLPETYWYISVICSGQAEEKIVPIAVCPSSCTRTWHEANHICYPVFIHYWSDSGQYPRCYLKLDVAGKWCCIWTSLKYCWALKMKSLRKSESYLLTGGTVRSWLPMVQLLEFDMSSKGGVRKAEARWQIPS